jgi:YHS domain-containing protein
MTRAATVFGALTIAVLALLAGYVVGAGAAYALDEGTPLALAGNDPVRLVAGETTAGSAELEAVHAGMRYRFVDAATRDRFLADPARYAIQNETCPVVPGAPIDPSIFAVHEQRIYSFATEQCRESFLAAPEEFLGARSDARRTVAILLDGLEATTHHGSIAALAKLAPRATVPDDRRFVDGALHGVRLG